MAGRPLTPRNKRKMSGDEEDDEDIGELLGLRPVHSSSLYNKAERLRQANLDLKRETIKNQQKGKTAKVRFNEDISYDEDDELNEDGYVSDDSQSQYLEGKCVGGRRLLVTVPTGLPGAGTGAGSSSLGEEDSSGEEADEALIGPGEDIKAATNLQVDSPFRATSDQEAPAGGTDGKEEGACQTDTQEGAEIKVEERQDTFDSSERQDTFDSNSVETVLFRSSEEESELSEWFSRSVQLDPDEETLENEDPVDKERLIGEEEDVPSGEKTEDSGEPQTNLKPRSEPGEEPSSEAGGGSNDYSRRPKTAPLRRRAPPWTAAVPDRTRGAGASRPATAPGPQAADVRGRPCSCRLGRGLHRLPSYNGLRSEYGLTAEQLHNRERKRAEILNALRAEKEQRYLEQRKKRLENEITFNNWLIRKKREAEEKALRRLRQNNYAFKTIPAPTAHLDKIGILRRKMLRKENACFLLNEFFKNVKPNEQKTYRIYLGLKPD